MDWPFDHIIGEYRVREGDFWSDDPNIFEIEYMEHDLAVVFTSYILTYWGA